MMSPNNKALLDTSMKRELRALLVGPPVELTKEEASKYHPATDITFLERLDAEAINEQERTELLEHLAQCVFCRQEMERLCKCGALFADNERKADSAFSWPRMAVALKKQPVFAAAVCLLLVIGVVTLFSPFSGSPSQIAHKKVTGMLEPHEKNFSTSLPENGYRLNGTSSMKAVFAVDDHKRSVRAAYEKLVADYPGNIDFRTEFGKYLLFVLQEPDLARNEWEKALAASLKPSELKRVPELHLLLGIVAFEEGNDTLAQKHFRDALDLDTNNVNAKINMAISLYRSGERENATEMLRELRSERIPASLRGQIDRFLGQD